jgi:hypothetical protein
VPKLFSLLILVASVTSGEAQDQQAGGQQQEQPALTAVGDVVRSNGMANVLNASATGQIEQARQAYIQNQTRAAAGYLELRRYHREQVAASRSTPLSMEQYVRGAREQAPDRLQPSQLDALTGEIRWPTPLTVPGYATHRAQVERLFRERATGLVVYGETKSAIDLFLKKLKGDLPNMAANDYMLAHRFLESLGHTGRTVEE